MFNTQNIKTTDVIEVESALRAILRSKYPDVSAEQGSVLGDLVVKSLSYLATAIKTEADEIQRRLYLADLELSESPDDFQLLEDLAANFLVSSEDAPPKRGMVTFRFTTDILRTIPADITLVRGDNSILVKLFDSTNDIVIQPEEYTEVNEEDVVYYEYYLLMESVQVADNTPIPAGSFQSSASLVDLDSVFTRSPFVGPNPTEYSQLSLVDRMQYSLQSRNFTTYNGIQATILNEGLPRLTRVLGIGASDKEMQRDVIPSTISSSVFHSLGMANVVLMSSVSEDSISMQGVNGSLGGRPIVGVKSVLRNSVDVPIVSDFTTVRYTKLFNTATGASSISAESITMFSTLPAGSVNISCTSEDSKLTNGSSESGKFEVVKPPSDQDTTLVVAFVDNNVPVVQGLVDSNEYNTLASSIKAMAGVVVQLVIPRLIAVLPRDISTDSLNVDRVKSSIRSYVESWNQDYPISISGILANLSLVYSGLVNSFTFSGGITYIAYLPDGRTLGYNSATLLSIEQEELQLMPNEISYQDELLPLQVSDRVLNYIVSSQDINIEVTNV